MDTLPFAHLHCHSHYSLLDGAGTIPGLLERAKSLGMTALALTDHGNLHGALKFYQKAKDIGITLQRLQSVTSTRWPNSAPNIEITVAVKASHS